MELEVIGRKKTDSKKVRKGKTSESVGFVYQLESEDDGISATFKTVKDIFAVGDSVEFEVDSKQTTLPADEKKRK